MGIAAVHGVWFGHLTAQHDRGTTNIIFFQQVLQANALPGQHPIFDMFSFFIHHTVGGTAKITASLLHKLQLPFQLHTLPGIVAVQKGNVLALRRCNASIAHSGHTLIFCIAKDGNTVIFFPPAF